MRVGPSAHGLGLFIANGEEIKKDDFIIGACRAGDAYVDCAPADLPL